MTRPSHQRVRAELESRAAGVPVLASPRWSASQDQDWPRSSGSRPSPSVQRGRYAFTSPGVYTRLGPSPARGLQVPSGPISGRKCKWNMNWEGIAGPVSPAAAEPSSSIYSPSGVHSTTLQEGQ